MKNSWIYWVRPRLMLHLSTKCGVNSFLRNPDNKQTNKQTDTGEQIISLVEVVLLHTLLYTFMITTGLTFLTHVDKELYSDTIL